MIDNKNNVLVKLILKHSIKYIENAEDENENVKNIEDVKSQLMLVLKLAEKDEIDLSDINLLEIDNGLSKSIMILFENLNSIASRFQIEKFYRQWFAKVFGFDNRRDYMNDRKKISDRKLREVVESLKEGCTLMKVNFKSNGFKEHFYQLSEDEKSIKIFKKKNSSSSKVLPVNKINQIALGFRSKNIYKKYEKLKDKIISYPYNIISVITEERSFDFVFPEEKFRNWYLGLKFVLEKQGRTVLFYDIIIYRSKMKMLKKIKDEFGKRESVILKDLQEYCASFEYGYWNLSFSKVLLIYKKVFGAIKA